MEYQSLERENITINAWTFLAGLLFGSLVGAGTMLLLVPQSGKKTRAQIQQKTIELRDQTTETMEDAVAQAGVKANQIRAGVSKQAAELEQRGQTMLDDQKKRWSVLGEAVKTAVQGTGN